MKEKKGITPRPQLCLKYLYKQYLEQSMRQKKKKITPTSTIEEKIQYNVLLHAK